MARLIIQHRPMDIVLNGFRTFVEGTILYRCPIELFAKVRFSIVVVQSSYLYLVVPAAGTDSIVDPSALNEDTGNSPTPFVSGGGL